MKFFFDVDDTLYDQFQPFQKALLEVLHFYPPYLHKIYNSFKSYSDIVFECSQLGLMTMNEMYIYRIQSALEDFDLFIDDATLRLFQQTYATCQNQIEMTQIMKETLEFLISNHVTLGVITNGPLEHQKMKLDSLQINRWVDRSNIYISSEIGIRKPDSRIFHQASGNDHDVCYYVGDSYENDIIGAKKAGWHCIWLNKKRAYAGNMKPDYEVYDEQTLYDAIKDIVKHNFKKID